MSNPALHPITIVSGLPRSGTSLMMQMLSAGGIPALTDSLRQPDIDNPRGYLEFEPVKQTLQNPQWLASAHGKVVKMVHLLLLNLPLNPSSSYRIILMSRHLDEVLASQFKMLERLAGKGPPMSPATLKSIYTQQLAKVSRHLAAHPNIFTVLNISYNALLQNPAPVAKEINAFLNHSLNESAMLDAIDPTLYRNRFP